MDKIEKELSLLVADIRNRHARELKEHPTVTLLLGRNCAALLDERHGLGLRRWIETLDKLLAKEIGLEFVKIDVQGSFLLDPDEWSLNIRQTEARRGKVRTNLWMVVADAVKLFALDKQAPVHYEKYLGRHFVWLPEERAKSLDPDTYMAFHPSTVIALQLTQTLRVEAFRFLDRQKVADLLRKLRITHPAVVDELLPNRLSYGDLACILKNLLKEMVPLTDLVTIMECVADNIHRTRDPYCLTELVRIALRRTICERLKSSRNTLVTAGLDLDFGVLLIQNAIISPSKTSVHFDLDTSIMVSKAVENTITEARRKEPEIVLVVPSYLRRCIRKITEKTLPELPVLSTDEIPDDIIREDRARVKLQDF